MHWLVNIIWDISLGKISVVHAVNIQLSQDIMSSMNVGGLMTTGIWKEILLVISSCFLNIIWMPSLEISKVVTPLCDCTSSLFSFFYFLFFLHVALFSCIVITIIATLYIITSSVDVLIQLDTHWLWISSCENKNQCSKQLIKDCYWIGG